MIQLTLTLKITTAQVVETSVTVKNNSPIQVYVHPDDQTQPTFDILVFGRNRKEHNQNLEKLFKRAREKEITVNKDKSEFSKDKCLYYGMVISKEGASPDQMKVEAIKQAEPPRNAKELNSFLCTVQYNARFMENYAPQIDVLRALVRADVFKWEEKHQEAFEALKNALSADTVLAYFDPAADHEVHVDGCPLGDLGDVSPEQAE